MRRSCAIKQLSYTCTRPICPTAAAACSSCTALGLCFQPRRCMPSAMAPDETTTTSCPDLRSTAICCAQLLMAFVSRPAPWLVTRLLPTLTTMRLAWVKTVCINNPINHLRKLFRRVPPGAHGAPYDNSLLIVKLNDTTVSPKVFGRSYFCVSAASGLYISTLVSASGFTASAGSLAASSAATSFRYSMMA